MDPTNPASFNHRTELLSTGRRYHFVDQLPASYDPATTVTLLCMHGFPDLWYGWRHQIKPWVELGYRVVVPDQLGYGGTDKPESESEYTPKKISRDMAALLDLLQISKAVIIGHDWGCFMAARFALWHPDRLLALVLLSVPFVPPPKEYMPLEEMVKRFPNWGYQLYFKDKNSNAAIEQRLPDFFKLVFRRRTNGSSLALSKWTLPGGLQEVFQSAVFDNDTGFLTGQEYDYYLSQFRQGMNGPLNYYRTTHLRFDEEHNGALLPVPPSDVPVILIVGKEDPTSNQAALGMNKMLIPHIQIEVIERAGHWIMVQSKDFVTETVARFLQNAKLNGMQTKL